MKSCYVSIDRLTGVVELEAVDDIKIGDHVISELDKGTCLGTVVSSRWTPPGKTCRRSAGRHGAGGEGPSPVKEREKYAFDFCKRKIEDMTFP